MTLIKKISVYLSFIVIWQPHLKETMYNCTKKNQLNIIQWSQLILRYVTLHHVFPLNTTPSLGSVQASQSIMLIVAANLHPLHQ
jgi:hypothetical protein